MSEPATIKGRPDLFGPNRGKFGVTKAKRHPAYCYSNQNGQLLHKVAELELHWWEVTPGGGSLRRLTRPVGIIRTVCNQSFFYTKDRKGKEKSTLCELPKPDAVLCGRCHGTGPVFGKRGETLSVTKHEAKSRLGCIAEVTE